MDLLLIQYVLAVPMKSAKTIVLFVATLTMAGSAIAQTWTPTGAPVNNWVSVASSADGTRLAAGAGPVAVFTSTNSGVTWTSHSVADAYFFHSIVSSADGMKLMTLGANNSSPGMAVYTSTNAGVNWVSNNIPNRYLIAIASSADGNKLVAAVGVWPGVIPYLATNGPIFISTNSGVTWQQSAAPSEIWSCLASSADGTTLAAGTMTDKSQNFPLGAGPLYVSTNAGATWVPTVALTNTWSSIACSADGTKMIAAGRSIYTSTDSGVTWISNNLPSSAWASVASSADGSKLVAVSEFGLIYTSTNSGVTWM